MKEILTIHVGGAGCQIGDHLWELYCKEHGIVHTDGTKTTATATTTDTINASSVVGQSGASSIDTPSAFSSSESLFYESSSGKHVPLTIYFDTESSVIDQSKKKFKQLIPHDNMIGGKEDTANNYSRGFFTMGKENMGLLMDRIRLLSEKCDRVQGINIVNSLGGGTGSGCGMSLLNRLDVDYRLPLYFSTVAPSPNLFDTVVEPYNFCWSMEELMDRDYATTFYDNQALYDICGRYLGIADPAFSHINQIIAQHISHTLSSCRIGSNSSIPVSLQDITQSLLPVPNINLLTPSFVPFGSSQRQMSMAERGKLAFSSSNTLVSYDILGGTILSSVLHHRGNVSMGDNFECLRAVKKLEGLSMGPSWIPNSFTCQLSKVSTVVVDDSVFGAVPSEKTLAVTTNTTSITTKLKQIISKYDKLWSKRAFVHWYVGEGIEDEYCKYGREKMGDRLAVYEDLASQ